ncbi:MAG: hypothetical protein HDT22_09705 [Ruminococcus sp.]|nr:hypothetical protein [Ruminococcus sp.]
MEKKNLVKRKIAFLLALCMVSNFSIVAGAEGTLSSVDSESENIVSAILPEDSEIETVETTDNTIMLQADDVELSETEVEIGDVSKVEVVIGLAMFLDKVDFTVTLTGNQDFSETNVIALGNENLEGIANFGNLAEGEYTLEISANGFKTHKQNITVEAQKKYALTLTAGFCEGYAYEIDSIHNGVLLIGDINQDGIIDEEDETILVNAIDDAVLNEEYIANGWTTDLNGNGETGLEDLMFFSRNYKDEGDTTASIEEFVSPDLIQAEIPDNIDIEGSFEDMLNGEGTVVLSLADNEEVSAENPIEFSLDVAGDVPVDGMSLGLGQNVQTAEFDVAYIDENSEEQIIAVPYEEGVHFLLKESDVTAIRDASGNIQVNLGSQVAVKKVSIKITALMQGSNNLVEISKTEFVNGMEKLIGVPEVSVPQNVTAKAGNEEFTLSWSPCTNITGYEVLVTSDGITKTIETSSNSVLVKEDKVIKNYVEYTVKIRCVNGTWQSDYSEEIKVMPRATKKPDKPDSVSAKGEYQQITVSWSAIDDAQYYDVYYRLRSSEDDYIKANEEGIVGTKYTITGLEDLTEYEIYAVSINEHGTSPESIHTAATTVDLDLADMPKYNLINRDENGTPGTSHIVSVTRYGGEMIESELDDGLENTAWGAVDGNKDSYYSKSTWDDGGFNGIGNNGLTYTLDQDYTLNTIGILTINDISYTNVRCWDSEGNLVYELNDGYSNLTTRKVDSNGKAYYFLQFPEAITACKIQISLARYLASPVTVAETYFYYYDTLMDEVMDLYVDDLHTVLKDDVNRRTIKALRDKVNTPDEFGEMNPNAEVLLRELDTAEQILNAESLSSAVEIHNGITSNDAGRGFSGINAWQPLGVSIGTGEEVTIYVGSNQKKTGESTNLRLVVTQYHSESSNVLLDGANLKVGANTFKLSKGSVVGAEAGGALYIQYQGASDSSEKYSVRVTGGSEVPFLDLYQVTDEEERLARTVAYVKKLDEYVPTIEALHNEVHKGSENKNIDYDYDEANCILGASDILSDTMMYSLPAKQILAGAGTGTAEERAETILQSMKSMEDMMYLFYQHKGLNQNATDVIDQIPKGHLNIRYQRMFSGAFMYAAGNHIGIEWGSVSGMMNSPGVTFDEDGKYVSGNYFGWGVAHEIGHDINQGSYAVAEITNNYFSQLAQAQDKNEGMRFDYNNIYSKVTSGTKGDSTNIATQIGIYWQLHLAYDKGLNYKTYDNYEEQLANLFYARVDTYARTPSKAPQAEENGVALTLDGGTDQVLMRLACAAAEKNILEYFTRWGKIPNADTIAYASQFEKETRAIMYANDDSRVYALNGKGSQLGTEGDVSAIENVSVAIGSQPNQVNLNFTADNSKISDSDILGYEIIRCTISGGKVEEKPVGFAQSSEFTDTVTTMNNRTVFYRITLIDQYLNRSEVYETDMIKIEHDGSVDKSNWTIKTTGLEAEITIDDATEQTPCSGVEHDPAEQAIDTNTKTVYAPTVTDDNAEIILELNEDLTVSGLKYTSGEENPISEYQIYVQDENYVPVTSEDATETDETGKWILVAEGEFKGTGSEIVYFANDDDKYISTYETSAVKLVLPNQNEKEITITELDILAPTGDNVDFRRTEEDSATTLIGTLEADYQYGDKEADVIPAGSLVFTGSYKGNPAYNVVLLYDENGNIVGGIDADGDVASQQTILADVPEGANIADVSNGTWIYWIESDQMKDMTMPEKVRVELYRVNNAETNEGQRLVSDSLFETVPTTLPGIAFNSNEE